MNNNVIEGANKLKNYPADYINKDDIQDLRTIGYKDFSWGDRPVGDDTMAELNTDLNNIPEVTENISNEDRSKQALAALHKAADPLHRDINADEIKEPKEPKPKSDRYINSQFRKNFGLLGKRIKKEDVEDAIETKPNEVIQSDIMPEQAKVEARQIVDDDDSRNDEANDKNVESATKELQTRKTIPGSDPDPLGVNISNEERANWNGGKDRAVGDTTLSEMDNALASRTRPTKPGTEVLESAEPKGALGAGMLYSRDGNIPKPSEERPLNADNLEQITESNPEAVQEALPNSPIAEEARQITNDSDARNDEVNNQAAEETDERLSEDFASTDDLLAYLDEYYPEAVGNSVPIIADEGRNDATLVDSRDDYLAGTPGYDETSVPPDLSQYANVPTQETKPTQEATPNVVNNEGISDIPNPDVIDNVPDPDATISDPSIQSEANIDDWQQSSDLPYADNALELKPETVDNNDNNIDDTIEEEEEEQADKADGVKNSKQFTMPEFGGGANFHLSSSEGTGDKFRTAVSGSSNHIGRTPMAGMHSGSISATSIGGGNRSIQDREAIRDAGSSGHTMSTGTKGSLSMTESKPHFADNSKHAMGGGINSGNGGNIDVVAQKLPGDFLKRQPEAGMLAGGKAATLQNAVIERLEAELRQIDTDYLKEHNITTNFRHFTYNGIPLKECSGKQIAEINEIIDNYKSNQL